VSWVPGMADGTVREDSFFRTAFLLVAPRAPEGCIEAPFFQRLPQTFRFHNLRVHRRSRGHRGNSSSNTLLIYVHEHFDTRRSGDFIAKSDHLAKFPCRIDMQQRKRQLGRIKSLLRNMQHHARIFADRIKHNRVAKLAHNLTHDTDRFGLEPTQSNLMLTPGHRLNLVYTVGLSG